EALAHTVPRIRPLELLDHHSAVERDAAADGLTIPRRGHGTIGQLVPEKAEGVVLAPIPALTLDHRREGTGHCADEVFRLCGDQLREVRQAQTIGLRQLCEVVLVLVENVPIDENMMRVRELDLPEEWIVTLVGDDDERVHAIDDLVERLDE